MRFTIQLRRTSRERFLPINYQYELSSAIYRIISEANNGFSTFLHQTGYQLDNKQFRLFTFSRISFLGYKVHPIQGRIEHFGESANFLISFVMDKAAESFIKGLLNKQQIFLGDQVSGVNYEVCSIEAYGSVFFKEKMHYRCLSPILIKEKRKDGGENYLDPNHKNFGKIMIANLMTKWKVSTIAGGDDRKEIIADGNYKLEPLGKIYKNGVLIKQMTSQESKIIGYSFEFMLETPVELHEIGYYSGFGHLNSQGFGCVEVKADRN